MIAIYPWFAVIFHQIKKKRGKKKIDMIVCPNSLFSKRKDVTCLTFINYVKQQHARQYIWEEDSGS